MATSIVERFKPKTAIDVGCGTGALLDAFGKLDCEVSGLEYSEAGLAYCKNRGLSLRNFDMGKHNVNDESYDLATSFEVAEHFAAVGRQPIFKLLCKLSSVIVMSATTRGQVGTDHVNEQPHAYWIGKFESTHHSFDEISSQQFSRPLEDLKRR